MTFLPSLNFLTRNAFKRAIAQGTPIVLFNPEQQVPAINGRCRVTGPWPRTGVPVEEVPARPRGKKVRERLTPWQADVEVMDMRVVRVLG
jgi:hypothetical protein